MPPTPVTRGLLTAATALSGLVAGTTVDTAVVKLPTWSRLGPEAWADYTRGELPTSLVWYPVLGVGAVLVNLSAAVAVHRDEGAPPAALSPARVVAMMAIAHLATTAKAAPQMTAVRDTDQPSALGDALSTFRRWHYARTVVDVLAFTANLRALRAVAP